MDTINEIQILYTPTIHGEIKTSLTGFHFAKQIFKPEDLNLFEQFKVIFLNQGNSILGYRTISQGGITSTAVDARLIFSVALKSLATGLILIHNHPSGRLVPSHSDKQLTQKIKEMGQMFNIEVIDHIILSPFNDYYSFADEGLL